MWISPWWITTISSAPTSARPSGFPPLPYQVGDSYYELVTPCVKADGSDAMPNEPLTMTFDVTEFKDDLVDNCFFVTCYDYALNYVTYLVELAACP